MPRSHEGYVDITTRINDMRRPGIVAHTSWIDVAKGRRAGGELDFEGSWGNVGGAGHPPAQFHLAEEPEYEREEEAELMIDFGEDIRTLPKEVLERE